MTRITTIDINIDIIVYCILNGLLWFVDFLRHFVLQIVRDLKWWIAKFIELDSIYM